MQKPLDNNKEEVLALDKYHASNFVSVNQFISSNSRLLWTDYWWEGDSKQYNGLTIFHDAATGAIWVKNQVFLGTGKFTMDETCFEEKVWNLACAEIRHI